MDIRARGFVRVVAGVLAIMPLASLSAAQISNPEASSIVGSDNVMPIFLAAGMPQAQVNQSVQFYLDTVQAQRFANRGQALQTAFNNYQAAYKNLGSQPTAAELANVMQLATVLMASLVRYVGIPGVAKIASGLVDPVTNQVLVAVNLPAGQTLDDYVVNQFVRIFTNLYQRSQVAGQSSAGTGSKSNGGSGSQTGAGSQTGTGGQQTGSGSGSGSQTGSSTKSGGGTGSGTQTGAGTQAGSGSGSQAGSQTGGATGNKSGSGTQTGSGNGGGSQNGSKAGSGSGTQTGTGGQQTGSGGGSQTNTGLTPDQQKAVANAQTYAGNLTQAVTNAKQQINKDAAAGVTLLQEGKDSFNSNDDLTNKLNSALTNLNTDYINAMGSSGSISGPLGVLDQALVTLDINDPAADVQTAQDTLGDAKKAALDLQTGLPLVPDLLVANYLNNSNYTQYLNNTGVFGQALQSLDQAYTNPTTGQIVGVVLTSVAGAGIFIWVVADYLKSSPEALTNLSQAVKDAINSAQDFMQKLAAKFSGPVDPNSPTFESELEQKFTELWPDDAEAQQIWQAAVSGQDTALRQMIVGDQMTKVEFQGMYQELLSGSMSQANPQVLQAMKNILNDQTIDWPIGMMDQIPVISNAEKYLSILASPTADDINALITEFDLTEDQFRIIILDFTTSGQLSPSLLEMMNNILRTNTTWGSGGGYKLSSSELEQLNSADVEQIQNQLQLVVNETDQAVLTQTYNQIMAVCQDLLSHDYTAEDYEFELQKSVDALKDRIESDEGLDPNPFIDA